MDFGRLQCFVPAIAVGVEFARVCVRVCVVLYPVGNGVTSAGSTLNLCKQKKTRSMVAVEAMQVGRKAMWSMHANESSPVVTQTLITDYFPVLSVGGVAPLSLIARASRFAVARFWSLLQDFALVGKAPWSGDLDASHPFSFVFGMDSSHCSCLLS